MCAMFHCDLEAGWDSPRVSGAAPGGARREGGDLVLQHAEALVLQALHLLAVLQSGHFCSHELSQNVDY